MFTEMLIVLLLILLNGVFAMAELALVSARRVRLKQMAEKGSRGASVAIALQEDPSGLLSTAQVGITLIGILAGAYGSATLAERLTDMLRTSTAPVVVEHAHTIAMAAVVAGIGYVTLILGELVPKRLAMAAAERIASISARPMRLLSKVAAPVVWFLRGSTDLMLKMLRVRASDETISEEEVKSLIAEGTEQGVFHKQEREMIEGVLKMADRSIRAVMTPRPEVIWLEVSDDMETVRAKIRASGHSRFPVSRGDIEEIVGVVRTTDLMELMLSDKSFDVQNVTVPPLVVHDSTTVLRLIEFFKATPVHMAIVVDEYGSLEGVVTPADILGSIAGEFPDTGDTDPPVVRRPDGSFLISGTVSIDEVEHLLGIAGLGADQDFHTLAGFVLSELGHLPTVGEVLKWRDVQLEIVDMDGLRIDKVLVTRLTDLPG